MLHQLAGCLVRTRQAALRQWDAGVVGQIFGLRRDQKLAWHMLLLLLLTPVSSTLTDHRPGPVLFTQLLFTVVLYVAHACADG